MRGGISLRTAAVAVVATVATFFVQPGPAVAGAPGCPDCEGQNPATYLVLGYTDGEVYDYVPCDEDATTIDTAFGNGGYVELRYSFRCRTVWARRVGSGFNAGVERKSPYAHIDATFVSGTWERPVEWSTMLYDAGRISRGWLWDGTSHYTTWY